MIQKIPLVASSWLSRSHTAWRKRRNFLQHFRSRQSKPDKDIKFESAEQNDKKSYFLSDLAVHNYLERFKNRQRHATAAPKELSLSQ